MRRPGRDTIEQDAKRQRAALLRITGEWYCSSSSHYTKAEATTWRGRRICAPCKARLQATRKQATP